MSHDLRDDTSYQYEPLDDGETTLRLCRIIDQGAEEPSCPLRIEMILTSFENIPAYAAVSYRWGDPTSTQRVPCDGKWLDVTQHLYSCMSSIAKRECGPLTEYEYWWIDQICINQTDDAEKSQQVKRMKRIYSCSSLTFVWLQAYEEHYDVECMKFWDRIRTSQKLRPTFELNDEPGGLASFGLPSMSDDRWLPLISMLSQPWFERVGDPRDCFQQCRHLVLLQRGIDTLRLAVLAG